MDNGGNGNRYRVLITALVTVCIFLLGIVNFQLNDLENKLILHLTNHEIHIPRQQIVSKAEFDMYQMKIAAANDSIIKYLDKMEESLKECIGKIGRE